MFNEYLDSLAIKSRTGDFPGGPVVKTLRFPLQGVRELRFRMPSNVAKKKKKSRTILFGST